MEERALQTLKEMFNSRGVTAEKFEPVGSPLDDTKMYVYGGLLVIFSTKTRVTEKELNNCIDYAKENSYTQGTIIVSPARASDTVLNALRSYISVAENPLVQLFEIRHLQFNISKHVKVPKHRLLVSTEVPDILKNTNAASPAMFRKIDSQDPMARWVGARPGDLLEVTGMCESSIENKRYLFCMADVTNG
jgi:DNA-directed RNA polymerase subunit H (RpoH/RPB5)